MTKRLFPLEGAPSFVHFKGWGFRFKGNRQTSVAKAKFAQGNTAGLKPGPPKATGTRYSLAAAPPSTLMISAVMKRDSSEARKSIALATSSA